MVILRDVTPADFPQLVTLNNAAYPAVPIVTADELAALVNTSDYAYVAVAEALPADVLGTVIGMRPGANYDSENYRWFDARSDNFLYVDRIVVADGMRGAGIGRILYEGVFALAASEHRAEVTCEVNLIPANPESLAFHARLGFERVGEQDTKDGSVRVALLAAAL